MHRLWRVRTRMSGHTAESDLRAIKSRSRHREEAGRNQIIFAGIDATRIPVLADRHPLLIRAFALKENNFTKNPAKETGFLRINIYARSLYFISTIFFISTKLPATIL